MKNDNWKERIADVDIDSPIAEPLNFKAKLDIGEDAFASLRVRNLVEELWDVGGVGATGAAIASSSVVAGTFFAQGGILGLIGLGTAVTPVGWVIAAGVLSSAGWYGVRRKLRAMSTERVHVVPKFTNTPLDLLAISIFQLLAPISLKIAASDGSVSQAEIEGITRYFVKAWGYEQKFVDTGMYVIYQDIENFDISELANALTNFASENPDCNFDSIKKDSIEFLEEIIHADGIIHDRELEELEKVRRIFRMN